MVYTADLTANQNRKDLVFNERNSLSKKIDRMAIFLDYHPALLDLHRILRELQLLVNA